MNIYFEVKCAKGYVGIVARFFFLNVVPPKFCGKHL
jgi:hypothetical protein